MVEPPHQERFPDGSMSLEQVEQRFAELKQEVRRVLGGFCLWRLG
jgi:hypothetical protein